MLWPWTVTKMKGRREGGRERGESCGMRRTVEWMMEAMGDPCAWTVPSQMTMTSRALIGRLG